MGFEKTQAATTFFVAYVLLLVALGSGCRSAAPLPKPAYEEALELTDVQSCISHFFTLFSSYQSQAGSNVAAGEKSLSGGEDALMSLSNVDMTQKEVDLVLALCYVDEAILRQRILDCLAKTPTCDYRNVLEGEMNDTQ